MAVAFEPAGPGSPLPARPNSGTFPALFQCLPWFNVSGKDLFFSAHVDEVRLHAQRAQQWFHHYRTVTSHFLYLDLGRSEGRGVLRQKFLQPAWHDIFTERKAEDLEPSHLLADTCVAVLRMRRVVHRECSRCELSCGCRAAPVVWVVLD